MEGDLGTLVLLMSELLLTELQGPDLHWRYLAAP